MHLLMKYQRAISLFCEVNNNFTIRRIKYEQITNYNNSYFYSKLTVIVYH